MGRVSEPERRRQLSNGVFDIAERMARNDGELSVLRKFAERTMKDVREFLEESDRMYCVRPGQPETMDEEIDYVQRGRRYLPCVSFDLHLNRVVRTEHDGSESGGPFRISIEIDPKPLRSLIAKAIQSKAYRTVSGSGSFVVRPEPNLKVVL